MAEIRLRRSAERDLLDIGQYTKEKWSAHQAENYISQLLDTIEEIGSHPLSGADISWIRTGYRRRRSGSHLIFYVILPDGVIEIARILHDRSDAVRHLDEIQ